MEFAKTSKILAFLTTALIAYSCNNESDIKNTQTAISKDSSVNVSSQQKDTTPQHSSQNCISVVDGFIKWYKTNYEKIGNIQNAVVGHEGDVDTAQYRVNFANAEKYIDALRSSGFFSDKFLQAKLTYFKDADAKFIKTKQNDGPPDGFESDFLLLTQEPESFFKEYKASKLIFVNSHLVAFKLMNTDLLFNMGEQNGNCVIDEIKYK